MTFLFLVLTLLLVTGMESMQGPVRTGGEWPPEPDYKVIVTNNGPFFYVE